MFKERGKNEKTKVIQKPSKYKAAIACLSILAADDAAVAAIATPLIILSKQKKDTDPTVQEFEINGEKTTDGDIKALQTIINPVKETGDTTSNNNDIPHSRLWKNLESGDASWASGSDCEAGDIQHTPFIKMLPTEIANKIKPVDRYIATTDPNDLSWIDDWASRTPKHVLIVAH